MFLQRTSEFPNWLPTLQNMTNEEQMRLQQKQAKREQSEAEREAEYAARRV